MLTLYHCNDARSLRCLWLMEEMRLPYTLKLLEFPPKLKAPEFLRLHATGSVPYLQDGDVGLFESAAILEFLVARYPAGDFGLEPTDAAYGPWLSWLHFGEASLTTPLATMLRYAQFEPPERRHPTVVADYRAFFLDRLQLVEAALEGHDHLVADRFTAADISVGYALMLARYLALHKDFPPAVQAYWKRLAERPAFKAAREAQAAAAAPAGAAA